VIKLLETAMDHYHYGDGELVLVFGSKCAWCEGKGTRARYWNPDARYLCYHCNGEGVTHAPKGQRFVVKVVKDG
jgi:DnaJ-class molecular chaperone